MYCNNTILSYMILITALLYILYCSYNSREGFAISSDDSSLLDDSTSNWVGIDGQGNLTSLQVPKGTIIMWHAEKDAPVPDGWEECLGQSSGSPDFRGRMPLGSNPDSKLNVALTKRNVGETGGVESVTLTMKQMAKHRHKYNHGIDYTVSRTSSAPQGGVTGSNISYGMTTGKTGGDGSSGVESHNNMPPFYVLRFLIKK
jgi:hypothetical protein